MIMPLSCPAVVTFCIRTLSAVVGRIFVDIGAVMQPHKARLLSSQMLAIAIYL